MFALDLLGKPNLAVAQFVELGFDLFLQFFNVRKVDKGFGLLRAMFGHIYLHALRVAKSASLCSTLISRFFTSEIRVQGALASLA